MNRTKYYILSWALLLSGLREPLPGQSALAIGQWKSHLPFHVGVTVTQSESHIYYGTRHALLVIDKSDRALERLTKVEGLSQTGVKLVKYNRQGEILLIVYEDSNIDLLAEGSVTTLPDIARSSLIQGEKIVYHVHMANDSIAYLSANFGITTLNLRSGLFPNTIKTPVPVLATCVYEGFIYAATEEGLYRVDPAAGLNIDDFSNWEWMADERGFPSEYRSVALAVHQDRLYFSADDSLFQFDGQTAQYVHHTTGHTPVFLSAEEELLITGYECLGNCTGKVFFRQGTGPFLPGGAQCVNKPTYALEDEAGNIWYADEGRFFRVASAASAECQWIDVNSPYSINVYDMVFDKGQLWVAAGGVNLTFSPLFRRDGFFSYIDGTWKTYSTNNVSELDGIADFLSIAIHPDNGKIYAGAFLDALVAYDPEQQTFEVYNETNSSLQWATLDFERSRVAGIAFDSENNLWICNHNAPSPLSVLTADNNWQRFNLACIGDNQLFKVVVDDYGYKWLMSTNSGTGLVLFDEGVLSDPSDDRCKVINTSNSNLPTNEITCITKDREGAIWVGTKLGPIVFQCDPFDGQGPCNGNLPYVEVDGIGANLLEYQDIRAIGVDGANRKWFGTATGVFVISPQGDEQIVYFSKDNSPLFDNNITSFAFDHQQGEVFIGTQAGIVSYRSDATRGADYHQSDVTVFPNPVREDFEGPIAIQGLAEDATVKITDIAGRLVYQTIANGGLATWDGKDYDGRKVQSGVYLIFATSRNSFDPDVSVSKVLVIRKND
ncbi:MAG: hypothetical protein RLY31_1689 [Bacteroidota bacterium]|jgi:ligand-binding sensor domain-containing protein